MGQLPSYQSTTMHSPLTTRALEVADTAGGLAEFLAPVHYPSGPVLVDGKGATDWVLVDARLDPHLAAGTLSIPRHARRKLQRIDATGVVFDALLIGHELAPNTVDGLSDVQQAALATGVDSRTKAPDPAACQHELDQLIGSPAPDRVATKAVAMTEKALRSIAGAATAAAGAAATLLEFDPVVFGVAAAKGNPKPGELVALFYLTHWT